MSAPARDPAFAPALLAWFHAARRDLPWRREPRDPYHVWVSEVMLQQTTVDTVIPYFHRFIRRFPDVHALAAADEEDVLKAWEGLGYYSRARNLHRAARAVAADGGALPQTAAELRKLPGFGPYTAGAVASLVFAERAPAVDGNVLRVLARWDADATDVARPAARPAFERRALALMRDAPPGAFNEALMELGATVCTPRAPRCAACPVAAGCRARERGETDRFPVKSRKPRPVDVTLAAAVARRADGAVFLTRNATGLLAGLWAFPVVEVADARAAPAAVADALAEAHGFADARVTGTFGTVTHVFTHRRWRVTLTAVDVDGDGENGEWVGDVTARPLAGWMKRALPLTEGPVARSLGAFVV